VKNAYRCLRKGANATARGRGRAAAAAAASACVALSASPLAAGPHPISVEMCGTPGASPERLALLPGGRGPFDEGEGSAACAHATFPRALRIERKGRTVR
jgi:hypothetical protein